jgi:NADH dehydrogenase
MHILLTGGTGFVGRSVYPVLIEAGHEVRLLLRPGSEAKLPERDRGLAVAGSPLDAASIAEGLDGCEAMVHLIGTKRAEIKRTGLGYEEIDVASAVAAAAAMRMRGVRRIVLLSAAAIGKSPYVMAKTRAERAVIDAGLDWTIVRPSFVLGPGQEWPRIMEPILALSSLLPGHYGDVARRARAVTRGELAWSIARSLTDPSTIGGILDVPAIRRLGSALPVA